MTAEYLDRSSLVARMKYYEKHTTEESGEHYAYSVALREIRNAPAADVVPVVPCKDCKHYRNHPNGLCYLHTEPKENERGYSGEAVCVEPDDFCSYGERREE